ncbi:MAG TPA: hypothetical protein VHC69_21135 [Polyangiaceae bacterium]|nr:hypothetical protein [Polyangiaceae bacterium]
MTSDQVKKARAAYRSGTSVRAITVLLGVQLEEVREAIRGIERTEPVPKEKQVPPPRRLNQVDADVEGARLANTELQQRLREAPPDVGSMGGKGKVLL